MRGRRPPDGTARGRALFRHGCERAGAGRRDRGGRGRDERGAPGVAHGTLPRSHARGGRAGGVDAHLLLRLRHPVLDRRGRPRAATGSSPAPPPSTGPSASTCGWRPPPSPLDLDARTVTARSGTAAASSSASTSWSSPTGAHPRVPPWALGPDGAWVPGVRALKTLRRRRRVGGGPDRWADRGPTVAGHRGGVGAGRRRGRRLHRHRDGRGVRAPRPGDHARHPQRGDEHPRPRHGRAGGRR